MENIVEPNASFEFSQLICISPSSLGGGNYFIRILQKNGQKPFYIQPPKCTSKQGIVKSGKKMYVDLLFRHEDEPFHEFLEHLETFCKNQLFHYREKWFDSSLTEEVIDESFLPVSKMYKSGKFHSVRSLIPTRLGKSNLKLFDESENEVAFDQIEPNSSSLLTIVEIQGIRCSARSFQLDLEIKQMMLLKPVDLFETCLFSKKQPSSTVSPPVVASTPVITAEDDEHKDTLEKNNSTNDVVVEYVNIEEEYEPVNLAENSSLNDDTNNAIVLTNDADNSNNNAKVISLDSELNTDSSKNKMIELSAPENLCNNDNVDNNNDNNDNNEGEEEEDEEEEKTLAILGSDMDEVTLDIPNDDHDVVEIKKRNDVYFTMYKDAKRKAKIARDLAISSFLEAKKIRNTYLVDENLSESSDDEDHQKSLDKQMQSLKSM